MSLFCSPSMCKNRTVKLKQLHQNLLFFVLLGVFLSFPPWHLCVSYCDSHKTATALLSAEDSLSFPNKLTFFFLRAVRAPVWVYLTEDWLKSLSPGGKGAWHSNYSMGVKAECVWFKKKKKVSLECILSQSRLEKPLKVLLSQVLWLS